MRKLLLTLLTITSSIVAIAQIKQKSILLGGQLSYYNQQTEFTVFTPKVKGGIANISVGKAFRENAVIGINSGYSLLKQSNSFMVTDTITSKYAYYNLGIFFRQYKRLAKDWYVFAQADLAFTTSKEKNDHSIPSNTLNSKRRGAFISLAGGISYQLLKKLQIELTVPNIFNLQYGASKSSYSNSPTPDNRSKNFSFFTNLTNIANLQAIGIGFRFIL